MKKNKENKITHAAHIKRHTVGTSNEISFSVLDAAKNALDGDRSDELERGRFFGRIALFTLPARRKKPAGTPIKEQGLPLSTGDFVSVDAESSSRSSLYDFSGSSKGAAGWGDGALPRAHGLPSPAPKMPGLAVSSKSKRTSEEEIALRKARRRLSRVIAFVVVIVASLALLVMGGVYVYHGYQVQQGNITKLEQALGLITKADSTIIALDDVVTDPFREDSAGARSAIEASLDETRAQLVEADEIARAASLELKDSRDKEAANQAVVAVSARQSMVDQGAQLMAAAQQTQDAAAQVDEIWTRVLAADDLARDAALLVTDTTAENVQASKDKTNQALDLFSSASDALADLQYSYPDADLASFAAYIAKREESLGYALASDDAFLAKNKDEAAAQNEAYNTADAEAADLAKNLPEKPSIVVFEAYEHMTSDLSKAYSTARLQAGSADAFIRDYLGTESK